MTRRMCWLLSFSSTASADLVCSPSVPLQCGVVLLHQQCAVIWTERSFVKWMLQTTSIFLPPYASDSKHFILSFTYQVIQQFRGFLFELRLAYTINGVTTVLGLWIPPRVYQTDTFCTRESATPIPPSSDWSHSAISNWETRDREATVEQAAHTCASAHPLYSHLPLHQPPWASSGWALHFTMATRPPYPAIAALHAHTHT